MVKFTPPVIKKDQEVKEEEVPPPAKEVTASGPKDEKGDPNGIDPGIVAPTAGTGVAAPQPEKIFTYVSQMPTFNGDLMAYLQKNIQFPEQARENNITGRVVVQFIVSEDGSISDVKVVRSLGGGCDEEAVRVIKAMPKWKAGKQDGRPVKVQFTQSVSFVLQ